MRAALSLIEVIHEINFYRCCCSAPSGIWRLEVWREMFFYYYYFAFCFQGVVLCRKFCQTLPFFFFLSHHVCNKSEEQDAEWILRGWREGFGFGLQISWLNRDVIDIGRASEACQFLAGSVRKDLSIWQAGISSGANASLLAQGCCNSFTAVLVSGVWREESHLYGQHVVVAGLKRTGCRMAFLMPALNTPL